MQQFFQLMSKKYDSERPEQHRISESLLHLSRMMQLTSLKQSLSWFTLASLSPSGIIYAWLLVHLSTILTFSVVYTAQKGIAFRCLMGEWCWLYRNTFLARTITLDGAYSQSTLLCVLRYLEPIAYRSHPRALWKLSYRIGTVKPFLLGCPSLPFLNRKRVTLATSFSPTLPK